MNPCPLVQDQGVTALLPTLPTEVIEQVIDQARDSPWSLKQLTLLCKLLLTRARIHLFTSIVIRDVEQMKSCGEFLDSHPWVLPLVQKVTLSFKIVNPTHKPKFPVLKPNFPVLDMIPSNLLIRLPKLNAWGMNTTGLHPRFVKAQLALHGSTTLCYQTYGRHIQELQLARITIQHVSHFVRLVSAFTTLRHLICSDILLRKEHQTPLHDSAILNKLARPLKLQRLSISTSVDIRLIEYLLGSSAATLGSLVITVRDPEGYAKDREIYFERLGETMHRLSKLSLTVLVTSGNGVGLFPWQDSDYPDSVGNHIRWATRILDGFRKAQPPTGVRVQFNLLAVADLGCPLSCGDHALEACQALETSLLAFPPQVAYGVRFHHDPEYSREFKPRGRAGRPEFWSPTITSAFPNLNQRGLLTLPRTSHLDPLGHEDGVDCLVASPDNKRFVTASRDGTIIVWDAEQCTIVHQWLAHRGPVHGLGFSPDSRQIVSVGGRSGETLIVWDISNGVNKVAVLASIDPEKREKTAVVACTWSPDGALIASICEDATVCVWDTFTFQQLSATDPEASFRAGLPSELQWSSDSRYLAWCYARTEDQTSYSEWAIWDPLRGKLPERFPSHQPLPRDFNVQALSFDPQAKRLTIALNRNRTAADIGSLEEVPVSGGISDGRSGYVVVWDIVSGTALVVLGHARAVDVSFSPDGRSLVFASEDGSVKIWDMESWEETASLEGDGGVCSEACFSADGKYFAATSNNFGTWTFTVRLWRVGEASCAAVFAEHKWAVLKLAFSPDGEYFASGDREGIVHIRRLSSFIGR